MAVNGKPQKINYSDWSQIELIREIKKLEKRKKYGLIWDKQRTKEVFEEEAEKKLPILKDVAKNGIKDPTEPNNILIEGDNYHALSVLNYTHRRKIDAIYIDPPYNTGNGNSFLYNDKIIDKEDSYRHSKWLSFMYKRLTLAKNLLSRNGFIFISIDEHEVSNLRLLCDDVFGEKNFRNSLAVRRYDKNINLQFAKNGLTSYNVGFEYVIIYSKNSESKLKPLYRDVSEERSTVGYWKGFWNNADRKTMRYDLFGVTPKNGQWKWKKEIALEAMINHTTYLEKFSKKKTLEEYWNETGKSKKFIRRNLSGRGVNKGVEHWIPPSDGILRNTLWYDMFASKPIKYLGVDFDNPKNPDMIKELIKSATDDNSIVLDFFAGSGTTGHAVLELNKENDGNKKFILCTNNENNICTDVCLPRLKKIIKGYKNIKGEKVKGMGGNLKYFKTFFVESEPTDQNKKKMVEQSTEMLCLKEDCFELIKEGNQFKIFKNSDDRYLGIIYYYDGIEPFKKEIQKLNKKINTYVFSLTDEVDEDDFDRVSHLVDLKPIPSAILNIYKRIFAYVQTKKLPRKTRK